MQTVNSSGHVIPIMLVKISLRFRCAAKSNGAAFVLCADIYLTFLPAQGRTHCPHLLSMW